jgi:hypothetical protein
VLVVQVRRVVPVVRVVLVRRVVLVVLLVVPVVLMKRGVDAPPSVWPGSRHSGAFER